MGGTAHALQGHILRWRGGPCWSWRVGAGIAGAGGVGGTSCALSWHSLEWEGGLRSTCTAGACRSLRGTLEYMKQL